MLLVLIIEKKNPGNFLDFFFYTASACYNFIKCLGAISKCGFTVLQNTLSSKVAVMQWVNWRRK